MKTILNVFQQISLQGFKKSPMLQKFYLSGGTALSEFYLHHRFSEDLDFFTQNELDLQELKTFSQHIAKKAKIERIEHQHGFGLYTFFFYQKDNLRHKIDFGQYPFEPIEKLRNFDGLKVESIYDIAVNKTHTIAFHPRSRDFVDLFFILQKNKDWSFEKLLKTSFEKFEMGTDSLQVGENLLLVRELKDMPKMLIDFDISAVQNFFLDIAKNYGKEIWK